MQDVKAVLRMSFHMTVLLMLNTKSHLGSLGT